MVRWVLAVAAVLLASVLFWAMRGQQAAVSLATLAAQSVPLEVALANDRPTMIEFYADWCQTCQQMAKEVQALETQYREQVNFVFLNVDNPRWLPELLQYEVEGVPRFIFLDRENHVVGDAVGLQPLTVMNANLSALVQHQPLPFVRAGHVSPLNPSAPKPVVEPLTHGMPVQ
ncbi:MAG: thioredoxin domain-containing protein [Gloeomargarita sp. SKYBB_i_bin120]|nr:thioredoxin domain-containing protein [Gloeomargarita sp. SKYG98]MCS7292326.1 thioredoxin domain-containing protein [Gloeomargarita sp. SKYB120]MDW8177886.1 thioredoxin domain-containing protein [Gloeomargarita sp. SKYBB_i_bin120]